MSIFRIEESGIQITADEDDWNLPVTSIKLQRNVRISGIKAPTALPMYARAGMLSAPWVG